MKLIRFGEPGCEKPGFIDENGSRRDASSFGNDFGESFFRSGGLGRLSDWIEVHQEDIPLVDPEERWGTPVRRPSKIVCVGLNYSDHARESGMEIPKEPILFFKSTTSLCGPYDPIVLPADSDKTDWEVELAVVIGKEINNISNDEATSAIAGYTIMNDVSERAYQLEGTGQWVKGKSCDSFAPLGPFLLTADELSDPHNLDLWLKINGDIKQQGSTSKLIFDIPYLVSYISKFMTLLPGDVISTGTPPGVGMGLSPPGFLKDGDEVELGIEKLGSSRQKVLAITKS